MGSRFRRGVERKRNERVESSLPMYRIVLALAAVCSLGLLVSLGLGEVAARSAVGLSVLGHLVGLTYLGVSALQVRNEARQGRRPEWAGVQAERNARRVVPTSGLALGLLMVSGWMALAASKGSEEMGLVSRLVTALAVGVSVVAHGFEALSARVQNRLEQGAELSGRPRVAGRFSRVEPAPEGESAGFSHG